MAETVGRGQIHLYTFSPPDKRRPVLVLVLTRPEVIPLLSTLMVAPITSRIRGAPSEVVVGHEEGLKAESAVNLDHVQTVDKARLSTLLGSVSEEKMRRVCNALAIAVGCADRGPSARSSAPS